MYTKFNLNFEQREHLRDQDVDVRLILKMIPK